MSANQRLQIFMEFKQALEVLAKIPQGAIYLVPIRLEQCEVPEIRQSESGLNLRDIHWLDYWEKEGWELLVKAIEYGRKTESNSTEEIAETLVDFIEEKEESQNPSKSSLKTGLIKVNTHPIEIVKVNERGEIVERQQKQGKYLVETLPGNVELELAEINGGTFMMGSSEGEGYDWERPQHTVMISPFLMGKYPITQAQWKAVLSHSRSETANLDKIDIDLEPEPSHFKGEDRPVEKVTWYKCVEFCKRLSKLTGREYRLPSEAEWEYACRAGTTTPFYFGKTITTDLANYRGIDLEYEGRIYPGNYASEPKGQYRDETTPVGQFLPNAFGSYDMHGNLWEWCADDWHDNYNDAPNDGSAWISHDNNTTKVLRGGSWDLNPNGCRCAYRNNYNPRDSVNNLGFRVVCAPPRT